MVNAEYYREEVEKADYAFGIVGGKVTSCRDADCGECAFSGDPLMGCSLKAVKWLMSDTRESIVLTKKEKQFAGEICDGFLARDSDGTLYWYQQKPKKAESEWKGSICYADTAIYPGILRRNIFPFIQWKDEEPWSVEELRKLPALEYDPEDVAF